MGDQSSEVGERRALHWQALRMALLWVRKGGAFRRRLMADLRLILDYLKTLRLGHHHHHKHQHLHRLYEREMSFDETPLFRFKIMKNKNKPRFPCIDLFHSPASVSGGDDHRRRLSFMSFSSFNYAHQIEEDEDDEQRAAASGINLGMGGGDQIDEKAEEFIRKFHQQMKLQRQISLLRYNDMLRRSIN